MDLLTYITLGCSSDQKNLELIPSDHGVCVVGGFGLGNLLLCDIVLGSLFLPSQGPSSGVTCTHEDPSACCSGH